MSEMDSRPDADVPVHVALAEGASLPPEVLRSIQDEVWRMSEKSGVAVKELQIVVQGSNVSGSQVPAGNSRDGVPHESFMLKVQKDASNEEVRVQKVLHSAKDAAIAVDDSDIDGDASNKTGTKDSRAAGNKTGTSEKHKRRSPRQARNPNSAESPKKSPSKNQVDDAITKKNTAMRGSLSKSRHGRPSKNSSADILEDTSKKSKTRGVHAIGKGVERNMSDESTDPTLTNSGRPKRNKAIPQRFRDPNLDVNEVDMVDDKFGFDDDSDVDSNDDFSFDSPELDHDDFVPETSENSEVKSGGEGSVDSDVLCAKKTHNRQPRNKAKSKETKSKEEDNLSGETDPVNDTKIEMPKRKRGRKPKVMKDNGDKMENSDIDEHVDVKSKKCTEQGKEEVKSQEPDNVQSEEKSTENNNGNQDHTFDSESLGSDREDAMEIEDDLQEEPSKKPSEKTAPKKQSKKKDANSDGTPPSLYVCETCNRSYKSAYHLSRHTCDTESSRTCEHCGKVFSRRHHLQSHIKRIHENTPVKKQKGTRNRKKPPPSQCTLCGKLLNSRSGLANHMKSHQNEKNFKCNFCEKAFVQKTNLLMHISSIHEMKRPFLCSICGDSFSQQAGWEYHTRSHLYVSRMKECAEITGEAIVPNDTPYVSLQRDDIKCPCCDQMFNHLIRYLYHLREHLDAQPEDQWEPELLGIVKQILERNEDIISSIKIYKCGDCNKIFLNQQQLRYHLKIHEVPHGFPFSCKFCERHFTSRSGLVFHQRSHTDQYKYICGQCKRGFSRMSSLRKHCTSYHVNSDAKAGHPRYKKVTEDRFQCKECCKVFGSAYNLRVHTRTHTKERPFQCSACDKAFTDPSNLIAHGKRHHPDLPKDLFATSVKRRKLREYLNKTQETENPQEIEILEDTENLEASEIPQKNENPQETENTQEIENLEATENWPKTENLKRIENLQETENPPMDNMLLNVSGVPALEVIMNDGRDQPGQSIEDEKQEKLEEFVSADHIHVQEVYVKSETPGIPVPVLEIVHP